MRKLIPFDVETTTLDKGSPYNKDNKLVAVGLGDNLWWRDGSQSYDEYKQYLVDTNTLVGHNIKFDIAWLRRIGISFDKSIVRDTQLAEFIISNQTHAFSSLNELAFKYLGEEKLDIVKTEYWERSCSCHVSIVEKIENFMQKTFVLNAIIESMNNGIENKEMLKREHGEKIIQNAIKQLSNGELKSLLLVLKQRLEIIEQRRKESIIYLTQNTIDLWLKQLALFVEVQQDWQLTTAIQQEKLEIDCVLLVTQLWHILKDQNGWKKHHVICENTKVDTWFIPKDILLEYLQKDLELTLKVYNKQEKILKESGKWQLYLLQCADLLVLQEMEWNGILYDKETSVAKGNELQQGIDTLTQSITINSPCPTFNVGSGDHLSCLLYGGTIKEDVRVPVGVYKTGPKIGQTRFSIRKEEYLHEQLIKPLKGSALKKEGYYSTDEGTLKSLKGSKKVNTLIYSILKLSKLLKLQGTYFFGIPKLMDKMHWDDNYIHGQLNQCVARTGRLSASEPNQQNMLSEVKELCVSRF